MQRQALFAKVRSRFLELMAGYIQSPALRPEVIDQYIVPSKWGVCVGICQKQRQWGIHKTTMKIHVGLCIPHCFCVF